MSDCTSMQSQSGFKYIFNVTQINGTVFNSLQQLYANIFIERITVVCFSIRMYLSVTANNHDSWSKHSSAIELSKTELKISFEKQEYVTAR